MRLEWRQHPSQRGYGRLVVLKPGDVEVGQVLPIRVHRYTPEHGSGEWTVYTPVWLEAREAATAARLMVQAWWAVNGTALLIGIMPSQESAARVTQSRVSGAWVNGNDLKSSARIRPRLAVDGGFMSGKRKDKWQGDTWNDWWTRTSTRIR
jgi:hypothetical protein